MNNKVIIGLSGGVDSTISMMLLKNKGYNLEALFMKNWDEDDSQEGCNAEEDLKYARDACNQLNIKLHTVNFSDEYWNNIFLKFIDSYKRGYTPNPDILCNKYIKFKVFLDHAITLGASKIATGHYAKIVKIKNSFYLSIPKDNKKDQTYFLHTLDQDQLSNIIFPLADITKDEVKMLAKKNQFMSYSKKESMGICFIGNKKFKNFISNYIDNKQGNILDSSNNIIGKHKGMFYTTIGQREGIGVGGIKNKQNLPWYVYKKDIKKNILYVCQGNDNELLFKQKIFFKDLQIITQKDSDILNKKIICQIRHLGKKYLCSIKKIKNNLYCANTDSKVRAPAPGQSIVFFDGDLCMGGGIIVDD